MLQSPSLSSQIEISFQSYWNCWFFKGFWMKLLMSDSYLYIFFSPVLFVDFQYVRCYSVLNPVWQNGFLYMWMFNSVELSLNKKNSQLKISAHGFCRRWSSMFFFFIFLSETHDFTTFYSYAGTVKGSSDPALPPLRPPRPGPTLTWISVPRSGPGAAVYAAFYPNSAP